MAGDGASIGSVYVDVIPNADSFWSRFVAQNRTQAGAVGDDLGKAIGASLSDQIAKGIRDGLGKNSREPATRTGSESGGAFADAFRRRVEAALKSLPKVSIDADSSDADRAIAAIRARLDELRSKKVGVDIGAAEAVAELDRLRAKLDELGGRSANAQVRVDAAAASAELAAVSTEVDRLDGRTANVNVNTTSAVGNLRNLYAAGIALGPALVPGAAAGAAAIASIIPVAAGAAGAVGALALGLVGPIAAIKAMSAAQDQATQSGASLASRQLQIAGAADAVRSAQASLGNTLANVADQQRKAAEQVASAQQSLNDAKINADRANRAAVQSEADAERALVRAQRDALSVQRDLTAAREDAKRAAEDLANQVVDNAFAQQRATLAVHDAEQQLQAVRADPSSTARQRAEAELTFNEARQHLLELGQQQQRLTEDKARSDAAGIDGSARVVAAQQRVADSQEQIQAAERTVAKAREDAANTARTSAESVAKAQQAVADAQAAQASQARQAAFSVAQAQQAVIASQRSLQAATVGAATAGGAAMQKLQQEMDDLSPAGQRFATFLFGLRPALLTLRQTAEEGLLPGVEEGIRALLPLLPTVTGYVRRFSTETGNLAAEAGRAFAGPYWQSWTRLMVDAAIPAMDTGARVAYNFAVGIAGLVRAALPLGQDFGAGLLSFSQRFAVAANTLEHTQGYRDFLDYVRTQGPIVARTIGEVVQAAVRLVEAISPIGGVSLTTIRLLAETINALPVPVLTLLAGGIVAVVTASKGMDLVRNVFFSTFGVGFVQMMTNAKIAMEVAATEGAGKLAASAAGVRGAFGSLASSLGTGGLVGLGIGAAVVGVGLMTAAVDESKRRVNQLTTSLGQLLDAYRETGTLSSKTSADLLKQNDNLADLVLNTDKYGVSVQTMLEAQKGVPGTYEKIHAAQEKTRASQGGLTQTQAEAFNALLKLATQGEKNAEIDRVLGTSNDNLAESERRKKDAQEAAARAAANQTPAQQALGEALRRVADASSTATEKASALRAADEAVFGAARNAIRSQEDQAAAEDALAAASKRNADQHIFGAATLDLHTEAGRNNRRILEDRLLALGQEYLADIQAGVAVDAATKKHDTNRDALIAAAKSAHFDADEVDKLAKTFGALPTDPTVQVTVLGVAEAMTRLETAQIAEFGLRNGLDPAEARRQWNQQKDPLHRATGGPVFGPGGPTDDKIPAMLSDGEHVITAAEVKAAGGHSAIEEWRRWLLGNRPPQVLYPGDGSGGLKFATGGAVRRPLTQPHRSENWPFTFPLRVKIPSADEIRRIALFGPTYTGPLTGGLEAAVAFVKHAVGSPYGWAQAGPYAWDCSGIVSSAWNVAHGRNPYNHTFSTANEAGYFPLPGYGPFTAAWTNPGEAGVGGGPNGVGHTAAKIGNFAFESVGGQGVRSGSSVTPLTRFANIGHYDSGGPLPPGLTIARNDTGRTEWVLTHEQMQALGGRGGGDTHNWYLSGDGHSPQELAHAVMHEWAWANS